MEPSLRCPSCGNNLQVIDAPAITCPFCHTSVPVPAVYRPVQVVAPPTAYGRNAPYSPYNTPYTPYPSPRIGAMPARGGGGAAVVVIASVLLMMGIGVGAFLFTARPSSSKSNPRAVHGSQEEAVPGPKPPLLTFGGKGTGAGRFDDGRAIAIGPANEVWIADYDDGRIAQFDAKGSFVRTIQVPPGSNDNATISGLAADRAGHLFVVRSGTILRFSIVTGALEKTFPAATDWLGSITVDPSGTVWAAGDSDLFFHFDADGKLLHRFDKLIASANKKDSAMSPEIAVDGLGRLFIASMMSGTVYVFGPDQKFQNRFVLKEHDSDSPVSIDGIALDPRGLVYVGHSVTISVYDPDGTFLRDLPRIDGGIRSLAFDAKGKLFVMTTANQQVIKLDVKAD